MQPFSAADDPPLSSISKETAVDMEEVRLKVEMCNSCVTCTSTCSTSKEVLLMKLKMLCTCTTAVLCDYYYVAHSFANLPEKNIAEINVPCSSYRVLYMHKGTTTTINFYLVSDTFCHLV